MKHAKGGGYKGFNKNSLQYGGNFPDFIRMDKKISKIAYYVFLGTLGLIALLVIISAFPITGSYKLMIVQSGSMEPSIKTGSVVVVKPSDSYKIGDVITFGPFTKTKPPTSHRVFDIRVETGQPIYITKGDANNAPDAREVFHSEVMGRILFDVPYIGYAIASAKKPFGFVALILIPAVIITTDQIKNIWQEIKKRKEK